MYHLKTILYSVFVLFWPACALSAQGCHPSFINPQKIFPSNKADASKSSMNMPKGRQIGALVYRPRGEQINRTIDWYVENFCVTGMLILHNGEIVYERYLQGTKPDDSLLSASMSKSILGLLAGIAISEKKIRIDEKVKEILPDFERSAFGNADFEEMLRMTSGVLLRNSYEKGSSADNFATNPMTAPNQDMRNYLRSISELNPSGKVFDYNGAVTAVLGLAITERTGKSLTEYLHEKIWDPIGSSGPGYWIKNKMGQEGAQGTFAATLRDYGKLGLLVLNEGMLNGKEIVPKNWVKNMVLLRNDKPQPPSNLKYGLHIWIPQSGGDRSMFLGANGQMLFIDPRARTVIVHMANSPSAEFHGASHLSGLTDAVIAALRNR